VLTRTRTSVLSEAIWVVLKEKEPLSASWADRRGFWQQGWSMFRVASHCVVSWHQLAMGKDLGRPAMPARKLFFQV
jgi:hypothetical protein